MLADPCSSATAGASVAVTGRTAFALLLLLLFGVGLYALWRPLTFDDAYMFYRYAAHINAGLGIAWNHDGVPTYGTTSQLWLLVVVVFSAIPLPPDMALQLASALTGAAGVLLIAGGVARRGVSHRAAAIACAGCAILLISDTFTDHFSTGMDTMLAFTVSAGVVLVTFDYLRDAGRMRAAALGALAFLAFLARPDGLLCALGAPFLAFVLRTGPRDYRELAAFAITALVPIVAFVGLCVLYFGTPLPLSFYVKSANGYQGFQNDESSLGYLIRFVALCAPFILAAILAGMRKAWCFIFLVPMGLTIGYLLTVKQVMGWDARFYVPLLPYLVIPAMLSVDTALAEGRQVQRWRLLLAGAAGLACVSALLGRDHLISTDLAWRRPPAIAVPELPIAAPRPLPQQGWFPNIARFGDDIAAKAPAGTVIAASEVGYIGVAGRQTDIIDMVGLNDTEIARNGFSVERLIDRAPDLIWFPHTDYTGIRAQMLTSPNFRDSYEIISGAYNFGLALRRDSPRYATLRAIIVEAWPGTYPGTRMEDYIAAGPVQSALGRPAATDLR